MGKVKRLRPNQSIIQLAKTKAYYQQQLEEIVSILVETNDIRKAWAYIGRMTQVKNELERVENSTDTYFTCKAKIELTFHKNGEKN
jgi:hypothetical protein